MTKRELWERYKKYLCVAENLGLRLDITRMMFDEEFLCGMAEPMDRAFKAMDELERGAIANVDENRMVGHYWLRAPELAPDPVIRSDIENTIAAVKKFADDIHSGAISPEPGHDFYVVLVIGIGGSALGPQFLADALDRPDDPMVIRFIDNTDPDGIDRILGELDEALAQTLVIVSSKSGKTIETRNAMLEVEHAYQQAGLSFPKHAVAITCEGTPLDKKAREEEWLQVFRMWDWIGGRTSEMSAVGLLPAALQGIDVDALLGGARDCDLVTRNHDLRKNPAALLAAMWYHAGDGKGNRDMVIIPYRDRLELFARYLQQLVTESAGKEVDRSGKVVHQGLTVYGNKGSSDQHSYFQQLHDGRDEFFVTFLGTRRNREGKSVLVEEDLTTGDYLDAFLLGTREVLTGKNRESITITLDRLDARCVGILFALFERAVGLYTELIDVNAYHQPGVEAGKKAVKAVIDLQREIRARLRDKRGMRLSAEEVAAGLSKSEAIEEIHHILENLAADPRGSVKRHPGATPFDAQYELTDPVEPDDQSTPGGGHDSLVNTKD